MKFQFNPEKAQLLKEQREIDLEEVVVLLEDNQILSVLGNPNYWNQVIFVIRYKGYVIAVPCVDEGSGSYFIKTAYPNRKLNKQFKEN